VEGWDAIVVDLKSATAINGAMQDACDAHITLIVFNESATAPGATHIITDYVSVGAQQAEFFGKTCKDLTTFLRFAVLAERPQTKTCTRASLNVWRNTRTSRSWVRCSTIGRGRSHSVKWRASDRACSRSMRWRRKAATASVRIRHLRPQIVQPRWLSWGIDGMNWRFGRVFSRPIRTTTRSRSLPRRTGGGDFWAYDRISSLQAQPSSKKPVIGHRKVQQAA